MGFKELKNSSGFVLALLGMAIVGVPFALEQIGAATGAFNFPASKTVRGWFASPSSGRRETIAKPVDWVRYREALENFDQWTRSRPELMIRLPPEEVVEIKVMEEKKVDRQIWPVPVVSCTAGDPRGGRKGYVFVSGFERPFEEGALIAPSKDLCGYEIVRVGERSVWFRVVMQSEGDVPMGIAQFPEFARVEGESLVRGARRYVARDAFPLSSGGWLVVDSFLPPDGAFFKLLDEKRSVVATFLCVTIGEKGGR